MRKRNLNVSAFFRTSSLCFLLMFCLLFNGFGQSDAPVTVDWDKTYGGSRDDQLKKIIPSPDGGYLLCGDSNSPAGFEKTRGDRNMEESRNHDYWIVRVDANGQVLWDKTFGSTGLENIASAIALEDGGFLIGGSSSSDAAYEKSEDAQSMDFWIIRIDAQGDVVWDKTIGGNGSETLCDLIAEPGGGYLLAGSTTSVFDIDRKDPSEFRRYNDFLVTRIDEQGETLWSKTYGGTGSDELTAVAVSENGNILLCGSSNSEAGFEKSEGQRIEPGSEMYFYDDFWAVCIKPNGELLWERTLGGFHRDELTTATALADGGFLLGGRSISDATGEKTGFNRGYFDYWLVRLDEQGAIVWDKTFGSDRHDYLQKVLVLPENNGFLLGGHSSGHQSFEKSEYPIGYGPDDFWLIRLDAFGNILWDKILGGSDYDQLTDMLFLSEDKLLLAGRSKSGNGDDKSESGRGNYDYWLLQITDGSIKEELKHVFPERLAAPNLGTLDVYGAPFNANSTVTLFRDGQTITPERYLSVMQYKAQCVFDFAESDLGVWHVAVAFNDTLSDTLWNALTVEQLEPFSPCVEIVGQPEARAKKWNAYCFSISNPTNGDRRGVPLWVALPDTGAEYQIRFRIVDGSPLDSAWQDLNIDWQSLAGPIADNPSVLPLYLPYLPAGKTAVLCVMIKADFGSDEFKLRAWTNDLHNGEDFERLGLNCLYVALTAIGAEAVPDVVSDIGNLETWRQCAAQAAVDVQRDLRLVSHYWQPYPLYSAMTQQQFYYAAARRIFDCMDYALNAQQQENLVDAVNAMLNYGNLVAKAKPTEYMRCAELGRGIDQDNFPCLERDQNGIDADRDSTLSPDEAAFMQGLTEPCLHASYLFSPVCEAELAVRVVNSYDPNNKVGVKGAGDNGYLPELQPFKYVINYENKPDATAPAQEVFIYDTLDAEVFDLTTFRFGAVGFGDTLVEPVVYPDSMKAEIDLRPAQPYIVRVTGTLNRSFNSAEWHFETLDPETMELITDPRGGFLPPNQTSPEGQGFVFFTVEPKDGLASGAELRNDAKIVFDLNPPIYTEPWINTLDQDLPESIASAALANDTTIALEWRGTDATSGLAHYTVYMSVDDGAYTPVFWQTTEQAAQILAEAGHIYRFYSIATDAVNNVEPTPDIADATILVVSRAEGFAASAGFSAAAQPNPFSGQTTFALDLKQPAELDLEVRDLSGRLVATESFAAPQGRSERAFDGSSLSAGAYFYTLRAKDGRKAEGKLIVK